MLTVQQADRDCGGGDEDACGAPALPDGDGGGNALVSARGTVRGVRDKVRSSIAVLLEADDQKTYRRAEEGKVCLYTTSMGAVRGTRERCVAIRKILQTHRVRYEERDVSELHDHYVQLCHRLGRQSVAVPQLFAGGELVGDAERVVQLNETGELRRLLEPFRKLEGAPSVCSGCGGLRFVPCSTCRGSKKSPLANAFKPSLRCMRCDKRGLVRCAHCLDQQE